MKNTIKILFSILLCSMFGCENSDEDFEFEAVVHTVFAGNFYYDPQNIVINQGEQVRWINDGGLHDVNGEINSITNIPFNNPELFNSESTSIVGAEIYKYTFMYMAVSCLLCSHSLYSGYTIPCFSTHQHAE